MNIKELAKQYACHTETMTGAETEYIFDLEDLQSFAELVAAAERERIKQENQRCYVFNPDGTYQGSGGGGRPRGEGGEK